MLQIGCARDAYATSVCTQVLIQRSGLADQGEVGIEEVADDASDLAGHIRRNTQKVLGVEVRSGAAVLWSSHHRMCDSSTGTVDLVICRPLIASEIGCGR
jgi:hypothetical protein